MPKYKESLGNCSCGQEAKHIYKGDRICKKCKQWRENARKAEWKLNNREAWLKSNKESRKKYSINHPERDESYRWAKKLELMNKYGGRCVFCAEEELVLLTLDHINGGGNIERQGIKELSINYYCKLLREEKRSDLRCLCITCNWKAMVYGGDQTIWPEKEKRIQRLLKEREERLRKD